MRCRYGLSETADPVRHHLLSFSRYSPSLSRFPPIHSFSKIRLTCSTLPSFFTLLRHFPAVPTEAKGSAAGGPELAREPSPRLSVASLRDRRLPREAD